MFFPEMESTHLGYGGKAGWETVPEKNLEEIFREKQVQKSRQTTEDAWVAGFFGPFF